MNEQPAKALSAFEQADLQKERDELYNALSKVINEYITNDNINPRIISIAEIILIKYYKGTL